MFFDDCFVYCGPTPICKTGGSSHHVELFDFGNTLQTIADKMRVLSSSLSTMEGPTMGCRLYGLDESRINAVDPCTQLTNMVEVRTLYKLLVEEDGIQLVKISDIKDQLVGQNVGTSSAKTSVIKRPSWIRSVAGKMRRR